MVMPRWGERCLRVGLVPDLPIIELGVARMLRPHAGDITFLGPWTGASPDDSPRPDVILRDPTLPLPRGVTCPGPIPWVGFGWRPSRALVAAALEDRALGFLDKAVEATELVAALRRIQLGHTVVADCVWPDQAATDLRQVQAAHPVSS